MQPGVVALRGAVTAAWEDDLRAVRQDSYDTGVGKEALAFIQRFYSLIPQLRTPIQRAWGPGGLVHVAAIRSTGLSASLGIGEYVAGLLVDETAIVLEQTRPLPAPPRAPAAGPWWERAARHHGTSPSAGDLR